MTDRSITTGPAMPRAGAGAAPQTREERLAAKLRENLRRRKAQARALGAEGPAAEPATEPGGERAKEPAGDSGPTLSKPGPSR